MILSVRLVSCGLWTTALASTIWAQGSSALQEHIDRAKQVAGDQWAQAAEYFCAEASMPNRPTDPAIKPTRLFDDLSVIGSVGTALYVLETSDGLVLIDAGYPDQAQTVVLPGIQALGLDPAKVRVVIVLHGHSDHFGAARYLQDNFGTSVYLAAKDWDLLDAPAAAKGKASKGPPTIPPRRDRVVEDLQPIKIGDTSILPVLVPGHTKGSLALIFPVTDHGERHVAGIFGGSVLSAGFVTAEGLAEYVDSVRKYAKVAAEQHVDVEIQNHPLMDGFAGRLELLAQRGPQDPNPFVVGEDAYANFLEVMTECGEAQLIRKSSR